MERVFIDIFREILRHLNAVDLCQCASVNKQWCYEVNSAGLWRDLFLKNYAFDSAPDVSEKDIAFNDLVRTQMVPQIFNDWKRAYICKIKCSTSQSRILCLSECLGIYSPQTPLLDSHQLQNFAHQPLMFEQFATKVVEYTDPPSTKPKGVHPMEPSTPNPGLFQQTLQTLGDDLTRAWMIVDASRSEDLTQMLSKEPGAIFTTLMGSFFNLTNVNNFPYLVKVSSCLTFCEHVYDTSGGNWCYIIVEHPSLQSHLDDVWYLNIDHNLYPNKEMKTMAILRRHLMKCYTWYKDFFRFYRLQSIIMMLHIYDQKNRDQLFLLDPITKTPIADYFILTDPEPKFFSEKITVIRRDFAPTKVNLNGQKGDMSFVTEYVNFLRRAEISLKRQINYLTELKLDEDLIPRLQILMPEAKSYGFTDERSMVMYFAMYYRDPKFTENPLVKEVLGGSQGQDNYTRLRLISEILDSQKKAAQDNNAEQKKPE